MQDAGMIRIRRDLSYWIAHKRSQEGLEEELSKSQMRCTALRTVVTNQASTIQKLAAELKASHSFIPPHLIAEFLLIENPRKRAAACSLDSDTTGSDATDL